MNRAVFDGADRLNVPCNVADVPDLCRFYVPSTVRKGDLKVAFSSNGQSPALMAGLRRKFDKDLGEEFEAIGYVAEQKSRAAVAKAEIRTPGSKKILARGESKFVLLK